MGMEMVEQVTDAVAVETGTTGLTVLVCADPTTKTYFVDSDGLVGKSSFNTKGRKYKAVAVPVADIYELGGLILDQANKPNRCVIRGELIPEFADASMG